MTGAYRQYNEILPLELKASIDDTAQGNILTVFVYPLWVSHTAVFLKDEGKSQPINCNCIWPAKESGKNGDSFWRYTTQMLQPQCDDLVEWQGKMLLYFCK